MPSTSDGTPGSGSDAPVAGDALGVPAAVDGPAAADSAGESAPAAPAAAPQTRAKTKGVADVVFLIDVSGSMAPIIDALRKNIETFWTRSNGGLQYRRPRVLDWPASRVFRDIDAAHTKARVLEIILSCATQPSSNRAGLLRHRGLRRPESFSCLYRRRWKRPQGAPSGILELDPERRRPRLVVFTDQRQGTMTSLSQSALSGRGHVVMANRIILSVAPTSRLRSTQPDRQSDGSGGYEGLNAHEGCKIYADPANFRTTLALAASVSLSAETVGSTREEWSAPWRRAKVGDTIRVSRHQVFGP